MKLKNYMAMCLLLMTTVAFATDLGRNPIGKPTKTPVEKSITRMTLTAQENTMLMKLNSLNKANKDTVLFVLDSLCKKDKKIRKKKTSKK